MIKIATSQYRYSGLGRLDVTVKGKDPLGKIYAPTWDMVSGIKAGVLTETDYTIRYRELMRKRYFNNYEQWVKPLLSNPELIVLICFCGPDKFCHRHLLADYMSKVAKALGIEVNLIGEI